MTSPLVGIFFIEQWQRKNWVQVGTVFERVFLTAIAHGLKFRPISNCVWAEKWRQKVSALVPHKKGFPAIAFYCGS